MKLFFPCIACIILMLSTSAQEDKKPFFLNELAISCNAVSVADGSGYGFGAGVHHAAFRKHPFNFISGIEYNYIDQFKKATQHGQLDPFLKNVHFQMSTVSVPLSVRFNIGKNVKLFIEAGAYAEFMIDSKTTGTQVRWGWVAYDYPSHPQLVPKDYEYNSARDLCIFNGGPSGGIGISIPLSSKTGLIVKSDYHHGLRNLSDDGVFNRYARLVIALKLN